MTPAAFRDTLRALGVSQARLARILDANPTTPYRWASGDSAIPRAVELLLTAWAAHPDLIPEEA